MSTSRLDGLMRAANNRRSFDHVTFNEMSPLARSQGQLDAVAGMAGQIRNTVGAFMSDTELSQAASLLQHVASVAGRR